MKKTSARSGSKGEVGSKPKVKFGSSGCGRLESKTLGTAKPGFGKVKAMEQKNMQH